MARRYGLDPAARQITNAANTIMQGVQTAQDMSWRQEQRSYKRQQREREDQSDELALQLTQGLGVADQQGGDQDQPVQGQGASRGSQVGLQGPPQAVTAEQTQEAVETPTGIGLRKQPAQGSPSQLSQGVSPDQGSGAQVQAPQQGESGLSPDDPLYQAQEPLKIINQRLNQMDLEQYDPATVRKAKAKAIQSTIDEIQFSSANMKRQMQEWEQQRQQMLPQAMSALKGFQQGEEGSMQQLASIGSKIPNGRKFQLSDDGQTLYVWDVADERTPENAEKLPVSDISYEQAESFIMPSLAPKQYQKQMLADIQAAKKHNREQYTNPHVFETEDGQKLYVAQTIDRRNDNERRTTISTDPFFNNATFADQMEGQVDFSQLEYKGRAEDMEGDSEEEQTITVNGKTMPLSEAPKEAKLDYLGLDTNKGGGGDGDSRVTIPGFDNPMERSTARSGLKTLLGTLEQADTGQDLGLYSYMQQVDSGKGSGDSEVVAQKVSRLAKESGDDYIKNTAMKVLDYMEGLYGIKNPYSQRNQQQKPGGGGGQPKPGGGEPKPRQAKKDQKQQASKGKGKQGGSSQQDQKWRIVKVGYVNDGNGEKRKVYKIKKGSQTRNVYADQLEQ